MTHLDLFTGIGGFHLAAGWAGFETVGFAEIDPYCCRLLAEKWPLIANYGDIRGADFSGLRGRVTVLSAGVPCQPASLAGKRGGSKDDRWLWPAVLDVVGAVGPAWCIFENPPGILSLDEFGGVLLRLESFGYQVRAFSVPANALGAKHRRQRVFIVAHAERERRDGRRTGWPEEIGFGSRDAVIRSNHESKALADAASGIRQREASWSNGYFTQCGEALADTNSSGWREQRRPESNGEKQYVAERYLWRLTEPPLCGRADGIPDRSHRLKALGNAVVPAQAYPFFAAIAEIERMNCV